jgi:hypothetical protein
MRSLLAGLACLVIGIGITEYSRRHAAKADSTPADAAGHEKAKLPKEVATLLELEPAGTEPNAASSELNAVLDTPHDAAVAGFTPVGSGAFNGHHLAGGFGAALFIIEAKGHSGLVRVEAGQAPKLLFERPGAMTALAVDGSTAFFAAGGLVASTLARGGESNQVRARFKNATVTSVAASGDTLVLTVLPKGLDPLSTDAVGAVVSLSSSGELSVIAQEQVRPRAAQTDGKDAYWIAGAPSGLWRGALDGAFSSQLNDTADEPLVLDGDSLFFRAPLGSGAELRRIGRAGGKLQTLITADVSQLASSSGLVRLATRGPGAGLLEMTTGSEPQKLMDLSTSARGLAVGGTTLFLMTQGDDGRTVVWAK